MSDYLVISAEEAEERYAIGDEIWYPYEEFADEQEIRLYTGDLVIDGDFTADPNEDWCPFNVIVDGDLTVQGNLEWFEHSNGCFLWVTGNLNATAVRLSGCPCIYVGGDLVTESGVLGYYGDDGGVLTVEGAVRAPFVISVFYFNLELMGPVEALLLAHPHCSNAPVDFSEDEEAASVLIAEAISDDGTVAAEDIWDMICEGKSPFLPDARPRHLVAREMIRKRLEDADSVEEFDLAGQGLREFPSELLEFPRLKRLNLTDNSIEELPVGIARLSELETLALSGNPITALPRELSAMQLRSLDLSKTPLEELPETFGDLHTLEELNLAQCAARLPPGFQALSRLERLDLSSRPHGVHAIPAPLFSLSGLRYLSLSHSMWSEIPDQLLQLQNLEELDLSSALGGITELPDLSRLPALRVLKLPGSGFAGSAPPHRVMGVAFRCATLEELSLDRWGSDSDSNRPDVTLAPDLFSGLTKLRRLDMSWNGLESLPESFFALKSLEQVDLQHNRLDRSTIARIADTFPEVLFELRNNRQQDYPDDPYLKAVTECTKQGSEALNTGRYEEAIGIFEDALSMCSPGKVYADHDEIYATYGIVYALGHWILGLNGEERRRRVEEAITWSRRALSLVPEQASIWHYTDHGAFHREVIRVAGNTLAWHLHEEPTDADQLEEARAVAARAADCVDGPAHWFIYDTQVRVLLKSGMEDQAYPIVARILHRDPEFGDFQDLKRDQGYHAWVRQNHSTDATSTG